PCAPEGIALDPLLRFLSSHGQSQAFARPTALGPRRVLRPFRSLSRCCQRWLSSALPPMRSPYAIDLLDQSLAQDTRAATSSTFGTLHLVCGMKIVAPKTTGTRAHSFCWDGFHWPEAPPSYSQRHTDSLPWHSRKPSQTHRQALHSLL